MNLTIKKGGIFMRTNIRIYLWISVIILEIWLVLRGIACIIMDNEFTVLTIAFILSIITVVKLNKYQKGLEE